MHKFLQGTAADPVVRSTDGPTPEPHGLGACAAKGCGGMVHRKYRSMPMRTGHRVESYQECDRCGSSLPRNPRHDAAPVVAGVEPLPPRELDELKPSAEFDLDPDPKPAA